MSFFILWHPKLHTVLEVIADQNTTKSAHKAAPTEPAGCRDSDRDVKMPFSFMKYRGVPESSTDPKFTTAYKAGVCSSPATWIPPNSTLSWNVITAAQLRHTDLH